jgi:hypothetical protein
MNSSQRDASDQPGYIKDVTFVEEESVNYFHLKIWDTPDSPPITPKKVYTRTATYFKMDELRNDGVHEVVRVPVKITRIEYA